MIDDVKQSMAEAREKFQSKIDAIRIGRATPAMIENVIVDYYGNPTALKEVAAISSPEPQQLLVEPWDKNSIESIETALQKADLGTSPVVEGTRIRLSLPPLTEERRKEFVKELHETMEEARIAVRTIREEERKEIKTAKDAGDTTEDERDQSNNQLQEVADEANEGIEKIGKGKEEQLMGK